MLELTSQRLLIALDMATLILASAVASAVLGRLLLRGPLRLLYLLLHGLCLRKHQTQSQPQGQGPGSASASQWAAGASTPDRRIPDQWFLSACAERLGRLPAADQPDALRHLHELVGHLLPLVSPQGPDHPQPSKAAPFTSAPVSVPLSMGRRGDAKDSPPQVEAFSRLSSAALLRALIAEQALARPVTEQWTEWQRGQRSGPHVQGTRPAGRPHLLWGIALTSGSSLAGWLLSALVSLG